MKCGKLTAKLRDAVPVCFIEEGKEIKRVKNIEIPDAIAYIEYEPCLLYTSPSPRDKRQSRMPSSA